MAGRLTLSQKKQLEKYIQGGQKDFKLLFSFSKDGASSATFHQFCNEKGPTVTVIYDIVGTVYGGYTAKSWKSSGNYIKDERAFLFRLQQNGNAAPLRFSVTGPDKAIYCNSGYGPVFGGGYDLCTFSGTITEHEGSYPTNASYRFGYSYDMHGITLEQLTNNIGTFRDLEVYSVTESVLVPVWRKISCGWEQEDLVELKNYIQNWSPPPGAGLKSANVLLIGPQGAGKSSFFNTIASIFRGHTAEQAACGSAEIGVTTKYSMYRLRGSTLEKPMKFRLCDTRGIEETQGIDAQELNYLLDGNIPNAYQFNPVVPISTDTYGFIPSPKQSHKIHCVCFVIDETTASVLSEKMIEKLKSLQTIVRLKGLPQMIIVTKIDNVCCHVEESVSNVFRSAAVKELVDKIAETFGVSRSRVLPVKNYEKEIDTQNDVSILALCTMRQILRSVDDFMFHLVDTSDDKKAETDNVD